MKNLTGRITNIQNYCVHDGPGIRTVVFMKGCPLRCAWCSNPETQEYASELAYSPMRCIGCGACILHCEAQAVSRDSEGKMQIDREKCTQCFKCLDTCYAKALHVFGEDVTVGELLDRAKKPGAWRVSSGITVSGGEPLAQADFVAEFLRANRERGTHTAIETSGLAPWGDLEKVAAQCNLIFYDIKIFNREKHIRYTGADNVLILENLKKLSAQFSDTDLIVRTPVIPGINDSQSDLEAIRDYLAELPHLTDYELLPYHAFGAPKYAQIGRGYQLEQLKSMGRDSLKETNDALRESLHLPASPAARQNSIHASL